MTHRSGMRTCKIGGEHWAGPEEWKTICGYQLPIHSISQRL